MTPEEILEEVERRGAVMYRTGESLRVRPASAIPPDLIRTLRAHKRDLLPLVKQADTYRGTSECWRIASSAGVPINRSVVINDWMTITDPVRCAEDTLLKLELTLAYRNAGHDPFFKTLIDGYVARLAACGVYVQVQNFS